jgi:hypothetical protein
MTSKLYDSLGLLNPMQDALRFVTFRCSHSNIFRLTSAY